jgi:hypothetical protein
MALTSADAALVHSCLGIDIVCSGMMKFTTSALAAGDRFESWRETRCRALFGVTIELARDRQTDFRGEFSAVDVGGATLSEMKASSYVVSRTKRDIGQRASNSWR